MMKDTEKLLTFYETRLFMAQLEAEAGEGQMDLLEAIQNDLLADPERGAVVKGSGGARKARVADPRSNRGKSGSYRYLYVYLELHGRIYLLYLFSKKNQADLNNEQKKRIAKLIEGIRKALQ